MNGHTDDKPTEVSPIEYDRDYFCDLGRRRRKAWLHLRLAALRQQDAPPTAQKPS